MQFAEEKRALERLMLRRASYSSVLAPSFGVLFHEFTPAKRLCGGRQRTLGLASWDGWCERDLGCPTNRSFGLELYQCH
jgi:hypothetical protein